MALPPAESAQQMLTSLLRHEIAPMLRTHGWKGSGLNYTRAAELYRASINFHKSKFSTQDEVEFSVSLRVWNEDAAAERNVASALAREHWGDDVMVIPTWGDWGYLMGVNMGELLPVRRRKSWRLVSGRSPEQTVTEVLSALSDFALPAVEAQMERPRVEPSFIVERRGSKAGFHHRANGEIAWHNVGGERLYPLMHCLTLWIANTRTTPHWRCPHSRVFPSSCTR